jgi:hypothetical protein
MSARLGSVRLGVVRGLLQLQEVVCGADHCPFDFHLIEPSREALSEASDLLDLAEQGFDAS